jgi:hypothetical protein
MSVWADAESAAGWAAITCKIRKAARRARLMSYAFGGACLLMFGWASAQLWLLPVTDDSVLSVLVNVLIGWINYRSYHWNLRNQELWHQAQFHAERMKFEDQPRWSYHNEQLDAVLASVKKR